MTIIKIKNDRVLFVRIARKAAAMILSSLCIAFCASCSDKGKIGNNSSQNASSDMTSRYISSTATAISDVESFDSDTGMMSEIESVISSAEEYFSDMMSNGHVGSDGESR